VFAITAAHFGRRGSDREGYPCRSSLDAILKCKFNFREVRVPIVKRMLASAMVALIMAFPLSAQHGTSMRDVSPNVRLILTPDASRLLTADSAAAHRKTLTRRATSIPRFKADSGQSEHVWFYYTLGGAAIGTVGAVALLLAKCDASCRDDGAVGAGGLVTAGALAGAVVGTIVGYYVDARRSADLAPIGYSTGTR
jgi:hypothetical protein